MRGEDISLAEQLDNILLKKRPALFRCEVRSDEVNYALGVMFLARNGIRLELSPKGPYANHFLIWENIDYYPKDIRVYVERCFKETDNDLRSFFSGIWTLQPRSLLSKHAKMLIKREAALSANKRFNDRLVKARAEIARLKQLLKE